MIFSDAWLKRLKPGDQVFVCGGGYGRGSLTAYTVTAVTPSGRIRVRLNDYIREFNANGKERGKAYYRAAYLVERTPELVAELAEERERGNLLYRIREVRWRDLPTATLRAVAAALDVPGAAAASEEGDDES